MTKRLVVRSAAPTDILARFASLVDQGAAAAAARFLDAVEAATERILATPGIGSPKELENLRLRKEGAGIGVLQAIAGLAIQLRLSRTQGWQVVTPHR